MPDLIDFACRETVSWSESIKLLEDAMKAGCSLNADDPGSQLPQSLHKIIEKYQELLFDWFVYSNLSTKV